MSAVLQTPNARLEHSREQLRLCLQGARAGPGHNMPLPDHAASAWLDSLRAIPGAGILIEAVGSWWAKHPLRVAVALAAGAAASVVRPIAQRHPLGLVLGALLMGGLLAWSRPWRWALKPALFAGLLPQFLLAVLRPPPPSPDQP